MSRLGFHVPVCTALALFAVLALSGCGDEPPPLTDGKPFDLFAFFEGNARSEGMVDPLIGNAEPFTAKFEGQMRGDRFHLVESFSFPDGQFDQLWDLKREGTALSGTVRTENEDGELSAPVPVAGELWSNGAILTYDGYAPGGGDTRFAFTHRMTPKDDGTVENSVAIAKFLLPVARSTVTFYPAKR